MVVEFAQFPSSDTTLDAARVYYDVLSRFTPAQRLAQMADMQRDVEALASQGVRRRHPDYNDRQLWLAIVRMRLGLDLFRKAFPTDTIEL